MPFPLRYNKVTCYQCDLSFLVLTIITWLRSFLSIIFKLLHHKATLFSSFPTLLFVRRSLCMVLGHFVLSIFDTKMLPFYCNHFHHKTNQLQGNFDIKDLKNEPFDSLLSFLHWCTTPFLYYIKLSSHGKVYGGTEFRNRISHRILEHQSKDMWQYAKSKQECRRLSLCNTSSVTNMHPSTWKLISLLTKREILLKKEKV